MTAPHEFGTPGRPRRRRTVRRLLGVATALAIAIAAALALRGRRPEAVHERPVEFDATASRFNASMSRRDWQAAVETGDSLLAARPRDPQVLIEVARALHNRAVQEGPGFRRPRPALRTSLQRVAAERRVMALLDSAAAAARDDRVWAEARYLKGNALEQLGFPIEALACYREARMRLPTDLEATRRERWVRAHLANPRLPDRLSDEDLARDAP